jgi:ankyrin repeat protein
MESTPCAHLRNTFNSGIASFFLALVLACGCEKQTGSTQKAKPVDLNQLNKALAIAVINDITNEVEEALAQGANPNVRFSEIQLTDAERPHIIEILNIYTPLTQAANGSQGEVTRILLSRGADPNLCNAEGDSALILAVLQTNAPIVRLLLQKGADASRMGNGSQTPLSIAQRKGLSEIEQLLDQAGVKQ